MCWAGLVHKGEFQWELLYSSISENQVTSMTLSVPVLCLIDFTEIYMCNREKNLAKMKSQKIFFLLAFTLYHIENLMTEESSTALGCSCSVTLAELITKEFQKLLALPHN